MQLICNRSICNAMATHIVVLCDQDFHYCSHHLYEMNLDVFDKVEKVVDFKTLVG